MPPELDVRKNLQTVPSKHYAEMVAVEVLYHSGLIIDSTTVPSEHDARDPTSNVLSKHNDAMD